MGLLASKPTGNKGKDSPRTGEVNVHVHLHESPPLSRAELAKPNADSKKKIHNLLLELEDRDFMIRSTVHQQLDNLRSFHDILEHHLGNMENAVNILREQINNMLAETTVTEAPKDAVILQEEIHPILKSTVPVSAVRPFLNSTIVAEENRALEPIREEAAGYNNRRFGVRLLSSRHYQFTDDEPSSDSESDGHYGPDHD